MESTFQHAEYTETSSSDPEGKKKGFPASENKTTTTKPTFNFSSPSLDLRGQWREIFKMIFIIVLKKMQTE